MIEILSTDSFVSWIKKLRDERARTKIASRINRLTYGNFGDVKPVGRSVSELRIDYGPGYRVYFMQRGKDVVILLCGGDKRTQQKDIMRAIGLAEAWREAHD